VTDRDGKPDSFSLAPGEELTPERAREAGLGDLVGIIASATAVNVALAYTGSPEGIPELKRSADVAQAELNRRERVWARSRARAGRPTRYK
jgi:hypothetical protein